MGKTCSSVEIKDKYVRTYLAKNYAGALIYVRKEERAKTVSRKDMVKSLVEAGFNEKSICKALHMYPCTYKAMLRGFTPRSKDFPVILHRRGKRPYTKKNAAFWNNHPRKLALQKQA